ncbi:type 1 glutamine amidotransferase [Aliiroseovarius sp. 2305UL8-7]|uniref:type 1 glutamine amidotransferase n=1 Tax=Aliiroseovarius conchicola TaxID=3121637 RepID=UPI0035278DDA
MKIAILMTNTDDSDFAHKHPLNGETWRTYLQPKRPDWSFTTFSVKDGEFPDDISQFDGWIVTGSPASVNDEDAWIATLLDLLKDIAAKKTPLFGACFGHQAIAKALGGTVAPNPEGWVLGSIEMEAIARPPWMEAKRFWQYGAHSEQVTIPPDEAQVILRHSSCPVAGIAVENHIFTTQNHPEFGHDFIPLLIDELSNICPDKTIDAARLSLPLSADNGIFSDFIIRFFELDRDA